MEAMTVEAARAAIAQTYEVGGYWLETMPPGVAFFDMGPTAAFGLFMVLGVISIVHRLLWVRCVSAALAAGLLTLGGIVVWSGSISSLEGPGLRPAQAVMAAYQYLEDKPPADGVVTAKRALWARVELAVALDRAERRQKRICESGLPGITKEACPHGKQTLKQVKQVLALGWW